MLLGLFVAAEFRESPTQRLLIGGQAHDVATVHPRGRGGQLGIGPVHQLDAAEAGLRGIEQLSGGRYRMDVIQAIADEPVKSQPDPLGALREKSIGGLVPVSFERDGTLLQTGVRLPATI